MKKIRLFIILTMLLFLSSNSAFAKNHRIAFFGMTLNSGIHQQNSKGFLDGIKADGIKPNIHYAAVNGPLDTIKEQSVPGSELDIDVYYPNGNETAAKEMIEKIKAENYDAIFCVGTPAPVLLKQQNVTIPVVFGLVYDPVKSGLVNNLISSGNNFTGASSKIPQEKRLEILKQALPNTKRIGVMYRAGESSSEIAAQEVVDLKSKFGLTDVILAPIAYKGDDPTGSSEAIKAVAETLVGKVDVILFGSDTLVGSKSAKSAVDLAIANKIPTICSNPVPMQVGAMVGVFSDFVKLGNLSWKTMNKILNGTSPSKIPEEMQVIPDIYVNLVTAQAINKEIPDNVLEKATVVIDK